MIVSKGGAFTSEYLAMQARKDALYASRGATKPFEVGKSYQTNEGKTVTCVELSRECARFNDGTLRWHHTGGWRNRHTGEMEPVKWHAATTGWRYNRESDRGRVTGTSFDHSDPRCVIPESAS